MTLTLSDTGRTLEQLRGWLAVTHPDARATLHDMAAQELLALINQGHPTGGHTELGQLRVPYWASIREAENAIDFYVVKSYITPIAWYAYDNDVVNEVYAAEREES